MARTLRLALVLAVALPLAARAADAPAPPTDAAKPALAPALQEKLETLQKDLTALQEAAKSPDVPDAQRTMVEQHVGHMQQMVTMMQSGGCCGGACPMAEGGKSCPMHGAGCPMMKDGKCPAGCPMVKDGGGCPMMKQGAGKRGAAKKAAP